MTEGIQQVFNGELTRVDTTKKETLGVVRMDKTGKVYKYVKYSKGGDSVAAVANKMVEYHGDDGMDDFEVTMDFSSGDGIAAGMLLAVIADAGFGWIQTKGPVTLAAALTDGADADSFTTSGAADGTLKLAVAAETDYICGVAIDQTAKKILLDCPW